MKAHILTTIILLISALDATPALADHRMGAVRTAEEVIGPDSGAAPAEDNIWELVFTPPDPDGITTYLLLHFSGPLEAGDQLEVDLGYDTDIFDNASGEDFWSRPIGGNAVTIRYMDLNENGSGAVTLDKYGRGEEIDVFMLSGETTEPNCCNPAGLCPATNFSCPQAATPSWKNVACLLDDGDPEKWNTARSVGIIIAATPCSSGSPYCVDAAWTASCPDPDCVAEENCPADCIAGCVPGSTCSCLSSCSAALIDTDPEPDNVVLGVLTAGHCFLNDEDIASASFTVDFQAECDGSAALDYNPQFFKLTRTVKAVDGCGLDYAIFDIDATEEDIGVPALPLRHTTGDPGEPADDLTVGDELFVIHHPRGAAKKVSTQIYEEPLNQGGQQCKVQPGTTTTSVKMGCDIDNGSSGSPLFDTQGRIVGVNVGSGGCANSATSGAAILDDWLCSEDRPLNYEMISFPYPSDPPDFPPDDPLLPGDALDLTVDYRLTNDANDGPQCVGETYWHRVYLADPTAGANPVGDAEYTWVDEPLCLGFPQTRYVEDWPLPCPATLHDTYQVCAELNFTGETTEEFYEDNLECQNIGPVCFPNLDLTLNGFFAADCAGCEPESECSAGDATTLCDVDGCDLGRCVLASVTVCNVGCAPAEAYNLELSLSAYGVVPLGGQEFCADLDNPVTAVSLTDQPGLPAGSPELPQCTEHLVPFTVPIIEEDEHGHAVQIESMIFDVVANTDGPSLPDCFQANNADSVGLPCCDCIDAGDCLLGDCDDCALCPLTCVDGLCPPDDDDDDDDRFGAGIPDMVSDCCLGPNPPPICYAFMGAGGVPCGDPRVNLLFDIGMDLGAVDQAFGEPSVTQLLESLHGQIEEIPLGLNAAAEMMYLAQAEIASRLGSEQVALRDLEWTHRLFNAFDLDLRTEGLEVPVTVPAGQNVSVSLGGGIVATFEDVITAGAVTPRFRHLGPATPEDFHDPVPSYHVDLQSTVGQATGSMVTVSMDYSAVAFQAGAPVLLFQEENGTWVDRTLTSNPSAQIVIAQSSDLGKFKLLGAGAVLEINCPPDVALPHGADTSPMSTGYATAAGNGGSITITYDDSVVQQTDGALTITRTWTASDGFSGKVCTQVIEVCPEPGQCPQDCGTPTDGLVGAQDLLALLAQWGQTGTSCDVDGGGVNMLDLLSLLASWGTCPTTTCTHSCCITGPPGCDDPQVESCVCTQDSYCCEVEWDQICVDEVDSLACGTCL